MAFVYLNVCTAWGVSNMEESFNCWYHEEFNCKLLPIFISWVIWNMRNKVIFEEVVPNEYQCVFKGISIFKEYQNTVKEKNPKTMYVPLHNLSSVVGYFDGASSNCECGSNMILFLNSDNFLDSGWEEAMEAT